MPYYLSVGLIFYSQALKLDNTSSQFFLECQRLLEGTFQELRQAYIGPYRIVPILQGSRYVVRDNFYNILISVMTMLRISLEATIYSHYNLFGLIA